MPKGRRHRTHEERRQISALKRSGRSHGETAHQLGRDPSSISWEIRRNGGGGYGYVQAQRKAEGRRSATISGARAPEMARHCMSEWKWGQPALVA